MPGSRTGKGFCSWSGGKDSAMALYYYMKERDKPVYLLTMCEEGGLFTRSHHLPREVICAQAQSLDTLPVWGCASWETYEREFLGLGRQMKELGVNAGVFGDIDIREHREWVETVCSILGITPYLPLWQKPRKELLKEFLDAGFEAVVVGVSAKVLDPSFLGRKMTHDLLGEFEAAGIDIAGENGEYHTVVTNGPIFSAEINLPEPNPHYHCGYWFQF